MLNPYAIVSNQSGPHPSTELCAEKHSKTNFYRPFAKPQLDAFKLAKEWAKKRDREIIFDSGCGTGDSTFWLSKTFKECAIIGIDQSSARLKKANDRLASSPNENLLFVRAKLEDFWRLALLSEWLPKHHFVFYPNPWPKAHHLYRRWHGHPVFKTLLSLSENLEIRSNWLVYLEEFALATHTLTGIKHSPKLIQVPSGVSAFERKYRDNNSLCYQLSYSKLNAQRPIDATKR